MMNDKSRKSRPHAVALFSGGLDSALAILLLLKQDIEVTALTFMTHFGCDLGDRSSCGSDPYPTAEKFGFNVKLMHLGQKFVDIVEKPKYGRGANMNVCVDCRVMMLREAKAYMDMIGADFLVTGEVMGQRPFSQVKPKMELVLRASGVGDILLRPLSAKLLPETAPERDGLVDRSRLEGISGRSRKRQLELAHEFGLEDYPNPASGCLLTDVAYSNRLRDLIAHAGRLTFDDLNMLRVGRHFRLDSETRIVVGRDEADNKQIEGLRQKTHVRLEAINIGSPVTLMIGPVNDLNIEKAAAITARYSSSRNESSVRVIAEISGNKSELEVSPAPDELLDACRIN